MLQIFGSSHFQTMLPTERARDDAALLRALRRDPAAFEAFYRRWATPLHAWLRSQLRDPDVAAELTAETFAQALVSADGFRGSTAAEAVGWLWGIARNLTRQYHRTARLESAARRRLGITERTYATDSWDDVDARASAESLAGELTAALAGLSDGQRRALQLRVVAEMDFGLVAEEIGCREPAARMRVSRALEVLRSRLQGVWS